MDGLLKCSRYAFGPNRLHYCGPDVNQEILAYIDNGAQDPGLEMLLKGFQTLYPYLILIAHANQIRDPFDVQVVEAYWLGNELLEGVRKQQLYRHLLEDKEIKKKFGVKVFDVICETIAKGALPHHSFHVFDVWRLTNDLDRLKMVDKIDSCRISAGKVVKVDGPFVTVSMRSIVLVNDQLVMSDLVEKRITRTFEASLELEGLKAGDIVTMHWGVICEKISEVQAVNLNKYTQQHLVFANQSL